MSTETHLLMALDILTEGTVVQSTATMPQATRAAISTEAAVKYRENLPWVTGKGIQGYGIGEKLTSGEKLKSVVLKVYVDEKKPESRLKQRVRVPTEVRIPGLATPIATDVEAIGKVEPEANTSRVRPAIPGFSVGLRGLGDAGTFGCLVRKKGDKKTLYILSNSHVLANEGLAKKGAVVLQPGELDAGVHPGDRIAELVEFVPFTFTPTGFPNLVDAAIARVLRSADVTSAIRIIGVPKGTSAVLKRGMQVQKCGRTTDYTLGVIKDINYRLPLLYARKGGLKARAGLSDQVLCTRYTASGDSGSAVLNMKKQVVGLHFAGSPSSSIFNKISHVLSLLKIEVVT